ncbi:MAG TPA: hypothetical protein VHT73_03830 [Thermodesulfobacteriota bacterium]|nr:hypothetical protein [Thermodesulfobacteriota bacterium]
MKKVIVFIIIIILIVFRILTFSISSSKRLAKGELTKPSEETEIIGKVISVKPSHLRIFSGSLTVKNEQGEKRLVRASSKALEGIKVGDSIDITMEKGKAKSIIKIWSG